MIVKTLGTRGSNFNKNSSFDIYGNETTSFYVKAKKINILIDAGSGVSTYLDKLSKLEELNILLTHVHFDHIVGLIELITVLSNTKINIYGGMVNGKGIEEVLRPFLSYPYWPIDLTQNPNVKFINIVKPFKIGSISINMMESNHCDGSLIYRLTDKESSVCFGFDFNHKNGYEAKIIEFAKDADLLIYDASYKDDEYKLYSDYGHSTINEAIKIKKKANVKMLILTHHLFERDDEEMKELELSLPKDVYFAKEFDIYDPVNNKIKQHQNKQEILLNVGSLLSSEKDHNKLFDKIIDAALDITNADAGTLYILKDNELHFKVMITKSMNFRQGGDGKPINLPPVKLSKANVCAACVLENKLINIEDVYHCTDYDFTGPKNYDKITGYKTTSVMVSPMVNDYGEIIGALQLINATNEFGEVIPFSNDDEKMITSLSSQAAICLTNMNYSKQIVDLLYGFIGVMSTGIDARTPYNANHTKNMVKYATAFLEYEVANDGPYAIDSQQRNELLMSIWLHDIGKLIIPLEVMDKATRLGEKVKDIKNRFEKIILLTHIDYNKGLLSKEEFDLKIESINNDLAVILKADTAGFLPDEVFANIEAIKNKTYTELDGTVNPYITDDEFILLSIRKGTLSMDERKVMESHVVYTYKMLCELQFPKGFEHIPFYSGSHHELLNGSGYPNHLVDKDIPWQVRLITIVDVFEALTARDRPYKAPMPTERALSILDSMVNEGKLDKDLLEEFKKSNCYE